MQRVYCLVFSYCIFDFVLFVLKNCKPICNIYLLVQTYHPWTSIRLPREPGLPKHHQEWVTRAKLHVEVFWNADVQFRVRNKWLHTFWMCTRKDLLHRLVVHCSNDPKIKMYFGTFSYSVISTKTKHYNVPNPKKLPKNAGDFQQ